MLKDALAGEATAEHYTRAASALRVTPAAAKQAAHRPRKRFRQLFREECGCCCWRGRLAGRRFPPIAETVFLIRTHAQGAGAQDV
jgi:hypothetical protein